MTYVYRLRDFAHGLALPFALALVHLRCIRTAGQRRRPYDTREDGSQRRLGLAICAFVMLGTAVVLVLLATTVWTELARWIG